MTVNCLNCMRSKRVRQTTIIINRETKEYIDVVETRWVLECSMKKHKKYKNPFIINPIRKYCRWYYPKNSPKLTDFVRKVKHIKNVII